MADQPPHEQGEETRTSETWNKAIEKLLASGKARVFTSREFLITIAAMGIAGLLIYKGKIEEGIGLTKWSAAFYVSSRTATKIAEVVKNGKKL